MTSKVLALPSKSNKQIQEYVAAYDKGKDSIFVYKTGKRWKVKSPNNKMYTKYFSTQLEAAKEAKKQAKDTNYYVYLFKANGDLKK